MHIQEWLLGCLILIAHDVAQAADRGVQESDKGNRMSAIDRDPDDDGRDSVDPLIVSLRAYVTRLPTKAKKSKGEEKRSRRPAGKKQFPPRIPPSDWVLVFDCETQTTPDQRLRFGAYQLRNKGRLFELGFFYGPEPGLLIDSDMQVLAEARGELVAKSEGERVRLLTRGHFVDEVLYWP